MPAKDGQRKAREVGIAERTLKRAKRRAGVKSEQTRDQSQISQWTWKLDVHTYTYGTVGPVGTVGPLEESKGAKGAKDANNANVDNGRTTDLDEAFIARVLADHPELGSES